MKNNKINAGAFWMATYTEIDFHTNSVVSFGNLNGNAYITENDAWNAIMKDLESYRSGCSENNLVIDRNHNRAEALDYDGHGTSVFWEIQKVGIN